MSALRPPSTARLWSPEAPYDVSNVTPFPSEVFSQSAVTVLFACSRMEKPTRLSDSDELSLAPVDVPPHPASAMTATADAATAAFHFALTVMVLLVMVWLAPVQGPSPGQDG